MVKHLLSGELLFGLVLEGQISSTGLDVPYGQPFGLLFVHLGPREQIASSVMKLFRHKFGLVSLMMINLITDGRM